MSDCATTTTTTPKVTSIDLSATSAQQCHTRDKMFKKINWRENAKKLFGGHKGKILRIVFLFLCALAVLVGIYRARADRIKKEQGLRTLKR